MPAALRFYRAIQSVDRLSQKELIAYFAYFLTIEQGAESASAKDIEKCFKSCDLPVPARVAKILSEGLKGAYPSYVKDDKIGYRLHRIVCDNISEELGSTRIVTQVSAELRGLECLLSEEAYTKYLVEAVDCFEAGANRASIVMTWNLAIYCIFEYIWKNALSDFNEALAKSPDKRIKSIVKIDDFNELRESKIIEICRSAGIISNDVRKILDECLGVRNTAAHPSNVEISRSKTVAVIEDITRNVVVKFSVK